MSNTKKLNAETDGQAINTADLQRISDDIRNLNKAVARHNEYMTDLVLSGLDSKCITFNIDHPFNTILFQPSNPDCDTLALSFGSQINTIADIMLNYFNPEIKLATRYDRQITVKASDTTTFTGVIWVMWINQ